MSKYIPVKRDGLTPRAAKFCEIFAASGSTERHGAATHAALAAGYSPKRAKVAACELLKHPAVLARLKVLAAQMLDGALPMYASQVAEIAETAKKPADRLRASIHGLALGGLSPVTRSESVVKHEHRVVLTEEQIEAKLAAMLERRQARQPITIDVTPEKVS